MYYNKNQSWLLFNQNWLLDGTVSWRFNDVATLIYNQLIMQFLYLQWMTGISPNAYIEIVYLYIMIYVWNTFSTRKIFIFRELKQLGSELKLES